MLAIKPIGPLQRRNRPRLQPGTERVIKIRPLAPEKFEPKFPGRLCLGKNALRSTLRNLWRKLVNAPVEPSPTPMMPISGDRSTRTFTPGNLLFSETAAMNPALPPPRITIVRTMTAFYHPMRGAETSPLKWRTVLWASRPSRPWTFSQDSEFNSEAGSTGPKFQPLLVAEMSSVGELHIGSFQASLTRIIHHRGAEIRRVIARQQLGIRYTAGKQCNVENLVRIDFPVLQSLREAGVPKQRYMCRMRRASPWDLHDSRYARKFF